ncbi:TonB-dependent receptor [Bordetella bronchiseptica]|uniref:TonB-dependent receptor n=1 Tax=Bordetella bronchiseptica TaxID=518 RepID=UPI00028FA868|nr:TonB-dependent receptor [Bordetella bronchiseptica]CCN18865.1 putative extracellular heme-binding protein [Bordetella bronchiseptica MO211]
MAPNHFRLASLVVPSSRTTLAALCLLAGMAVGAQAATSRGDVALAASRARTAGADSVHDFDIAAGPLDQALAAFASQSGLRLAIDATLTRGLSAPALRGRHTARTGLRRLLASSHLQAVVHDDGSLVLRRDPTLPTFELSPVRVLSDPVRDVYLAPRSSVHVSAVDIARFGVVSPADLLKGLPGVQTGDSRNGGGLDVNIRGIQGQSRVAVKVDGAEQALDVYRGYAGTQQRSYIDPDLVSDILIDKGPSLASAAAGAIGGTVRMRTIGVQDILRDGQSVGLRVTGSLWNNGVSPASRDPHPRRPPEDAELAAAPRTQRGNLFGSDAQAGSVAFAYSDATFDVVAAYARRSQGNYFTGRHGHDRYRVFEGNAERASVATAYRPGEEVLNASARTESVLLKGALRPADGHAVELGYRRLDGRYGEIMPSDIFRYGTAGIWQYPLGTVLVDTTTARYRYTPSGTDLVDATVNLWTTHAKTRQLNTVIAPASEFYRDDRNWVRVANRRIGGDFGNTARLSSAYGEFRLELGGAFQYEDIGPQRGVRITQHDRNGNRYLRDAARREFGLNAKLTYQPTERFTAWAGVRYARMRHRDHNSHATPRRAQRLMRRIVITNPDDDGIMSYGYMDWFPDANGQFTDATDPRLHNGIVYRDAELPSEGIAFDDFLVNARTNVRVTDASVRDTVTGYDFSPPRINRDQGLAPALGVDYEIAPDMHVYASYTEGLRMPSLFETSLGVLQTTPGAGLRPERAHSWEAGIGAMRDDLLQAGDSAAYKLAYFRNDIRNYITRYYRPGANGIMTFSNAERYRVHGLELQTRYDAGRYFADLSATYYLKTETCDPAFAAQLRASAGRGRSTQDTPDCTPGSFMGSYANTQNPPRLAVNVTAGLRLLNQALTLGARMTHTSGPTARADRPWQQGATTKQLFYHPVTVYDLFLAYRVHKRAALNISLQNLTDRYYLDPLAQSYMPAPGRTLRVGLQAWF